MEYMGYERRNRVYILCAWADIEHAWGKQEKCTFCMGYRWTIAFLQTPKYKYIWDLRTKAECASMLGVLDVSVTR